MSEKTTMTDAERDTLDFVQRHRESYLISHGREGHVVDYRELGGHRFTPSLLLKTFGRRSGIQRINGLIYGAIGGEIAVVASKGGADVNPAWYHNVRGAEIVEIQVASKAFSSGWREIEGEEYRKFWEFMIDVFPPYKNYQTFTKRRIPIICFTAGEEVNLFEMAEIGEESF